MTTTNTTYNDAATVPAVVLPAWEEKHYAPKELGAIWNMSHDVIIRLFKDEPGVLRTSPPHRRGVKTRHTYRIPASVATRVYKRSVN